MQPRRPLRLDLLGGSPGLQRGRERIGAPVGGGRFDADLERTRRNRAHRGSDFHSCTNRRKDFRIEDGELDAPQLLAGQRAENGDQYAGRKYTPGILRELSSLASPYASTSCPPMYLKGLVVPMPPLSPMLSVSPVHG